MPFLQITRQTSYKKGHKKLFCRVLTSTPRMKHVLLGKIFTLTGALGSIRSRLVTQRFSQVSWGGALRDETKTASKETTRYANPNGKLLILSLTRDRRPPAAQLSALLTELILPRQVT